jgi:hypothetical protein
MPFDWDQATNSVMDTAPELGVVPWTLYQLIRRGDCPVKVIRVGRKLRVITASCRRVLLLEEGPSSPGPHLGDEVPIS